MRDDWTVRLTDPGTTRGSGLALAELVWDARQRTLDLVADLREHQLTGPRLEIMSPLRWVAGHVAWFQERWVFSVPGWQEALWKDPEAGVDRGALYDCCRVAPAARWDLPLPAREETL